MQSKEEIHAKLIALLQSGVSLASVKRGMRVPYSSLRQFKNGTGLSLGPGYLKKLEKWLTMTERKNGRVSPTQAGDAGQEIGVLLHNLANFMLSENFQLGVRVEYLKANIGAVERLIPPLEAIAKGEEKRG